MQGGLLKSASAVALFAAAGLYGASPAKAADLGGDCCADLEERVAELEATTVRKGNKKVSLTISGFVSHNVMWWDDGTQSDVYFGDGGNLGSRWRFVGTAKISPQITAGFLYEFQHGSNAINGMNQLNGGDDLGHTGAVQNAGLGYAGCGQNANNANSPGCSVLRDSTVWLRHSQLGMVKIGHGSTATDNLTLIDLGGLGGAATSDVGLYNGGMILRASNGGQLGVSTGVNWGNAIRGHESFDTSRRNHVLYETPSLVGFTLQGAVAEDNYWDVALRYAGEFGGFRLAGGIGYSEDTKFNGPFQNLNTTNGAAQGAQCSDQSITITTTNGAPGIGANTAGSGKCDVKVTDLKGSASILHVPTGLFLTGAAGKREIDSGIGQRQNVLPGALAAGAATAGQYTGPDLTMWYLSGGISQNFFGIGKTVLFGEYSEHKGGMAQSSFLGVTGTTTWNTQTDSKVTHWGVGVVQYIDAAAMEVFATYKNYSFEGAGFTGAASTVAAATNQPLNAGVSDISVFVVGTRINF